MRERDLERKIERKRNALLYVHVICEIYVFVSLKLIMLH